MIHSQRVLLALTHAGMTREDAYLAVQRSALAVWAVGGDFKSLLASDEEVAAHLDSTTLDELFDIDYHLKHVDTIFERVFGQKG